MARSEDKPEDVQQPGQTDLLDLPEAVVPEPTHADAPASGDVEPTHADAPASGDVEPTHAEVPQAQATDERGNVRPADSRHLGERWDVPATGLATVTRPDGRTVTLTADADGKVTHVLDVPGTYTAAADGTDTTVSAG